MEDKVHRINSYKVEQTESVVTPSKEPPEPPKSLPVSARPVSALSGRKTPSSHISVAEQLEQVDKQVEYEYDYTDASSNDNNQEYTYEEYTDEEYQNGKLKSRPPPSSTEL